MEVVMDQRKTLAAPLQLQIQPAASPESRGRKIGATALRGEQVNVPPAAGKNLQPPAGETVHERPFHRGRPAKVPVKTRQARLVVGPGPIPQKLVRRGRGGDGGRTRNQARRRGTRRGNTGGVHGETEAPRTAQNNRRHAKQFTKRSAEMEVIDCLAMNPLTLPGKTARSVAVRRFTQPPPPL